MQLGTSALCQKGTLLSVRDTLTFRQICDRQRQRRTCIVIVIDGSKPEILIFESIFCETQCSSSLWIQGANQDLPGLGFVTQLLCDVGYRSNGGITGIIYRTARCCAVIGGIVEAQHFYCGRSRFRRHEWRRLGPNQSGTVFSICSPGRAFESYHDGTIARRGARRSWWCHRRRDSRQCWQRRRNWGSSRCRRWHCTRCGSAEPLISMVFRRLHEAVRRTFQSSAEGRFQVQNQIEFRWLLDRNFAWLGAMQSLINVVGGAPK